MNEHPIPYEPKRRSRITVVKGAPAPPVALSPLVKGMATGSLGNVPLTSAVYAQIPRTHDPVDVPIATVMIDDALEMLGITKGQVLRSSGHPTPAQIPQLILTEGETR